MAAVLENKKCEACKAYHTLFLPVGNMPDVAKKYVYDCPVDGIPVRLQHGDKWWQTVDARPQDAVVVREVG